MRRLINFMVHKQSKSRDVATDDQYDDDGKNKTSEIIFNSACLLDDIRQKTDDSVTSLDICLCGWLLGTSVRTKVLYKDDSHINNTFHIAKQKY